MSKKDFLSNVIYKNYFIDKLLASRRQSNVHILAYHRIVENVSDDYLFNPEIFSVTLEDFDKQMEYVSKNFNVVNFEQMEASLSKDDILKNTLIITFDDGYYDNYSLAMPVLNKYGLSATIFLATDYIDTGDLFWFDSVAGFINSYTEKTLDLTSVGINFDFNKVPKKMAFKTLGKLLKNTNDSVRVDLLDEIYSKFNFEVSEKDYETAKPLSWNNVIEMSNNNIEFGAHSKSHCFLDTIDADKLLSEVVGSKLKIENKINKSINSFCYPAGVTNDSIMNAVESSGIFFGVGYKHGLNLLDDMNQYNLNREHIELDVSLELFKANLTLPEIFMR